MPDLAAVLVKDSGDMTAEELEVLVEYQYANRPDWFDREWEGGYGSRDV